MKEILKVLCDNSKATTAELVKSDTKLSELVKKLEAAVEVLNQ